MLNGEELELLAGLLDRYSRDLALERTLNEAKTNTRNEIVRIMQRGGESVIELNGHKAVVSEGTRRSIPINLAQAVLSAEQFNAIVQETPYVQLSVSPAKVG